VPPDDDDADDASVRAHPPDPLAVLGDPRPGWRTRLEEATGGLAFPSTAITGARALVFAVAALAVVAVAVVVVASGQNRGQTASGSEASTLPFTTRRPAPPGTGASPPGSAPNAVDEHPATTIASIWVAVAGAVARPGLYQARAAARLSELIAAAGGLAPEADGDRINLAAPLRDGERVYVPRRGEPGAPPVIAGGDAGAGGSSGAGGSGGSGGSSVVAPGGAAAPNPEHRVNVNAAGAAELESLPGVGPATAAAIIDQRNRQGPFRSVDDLRQVRGIGPAKLAQIRDLVSI
jgi:competence protein ComEA